MKYSILLPVYNERQTIINNIVPLNERIKSILVSEEYEILLLDNGSTDNTGSAIKDILAVMPNVLYFRVLQKGRGLAIKKGVSVARGARICILSVDRAWDETFLLTAHRLLESGIELVFGQKTHPQSQVSRPFVRVFCSKVVNAIISLLFGIDLQDTQCVKAFTKSSIPFLSALGDYNYFAETEFFLRALQYDIKRASVPVVVNDRRRSSKVRLLSLWEFLFEAVRFRLRLR